MAGDRLRVLMIDDSDLALEFQQLLLERAGFEVRAITSVSDLAEQQADWPDFVLVDANMPDAEPADVCRDVRQQHPRAQLILVSGLEQRELHALAQSCGAHGAVSKSGNIRELPAVLRSLVRAPLPAPPSERDLRLRQKFLGLVHTRCATVRGHIDAFTAGPHRGGGAETPAADPRMAEARRLLHTIKGEASLLGLAAIATRAAELETTFDSAAVSGFAAMSTGKLRQDLDDLEHTAEALARGE